MKLLSSHFASGLLGALVSTALFSLTSMQAPFVVQSGSLGAPMGLGANSTLLGQQEILRTMSLVDLPDGNGGTVRTLRIEVSIAVTSPPNFPPGCGSNVSN